VKAGNVAHKFLGIAESWGEMRDQCGPRHEEDRASRIICYLLAALTVGMCLALLIIVERL
jgi:hypothetical protein